MDAALALKILGYVAMYGPTAEQVILGLVGVVKTMTNNFTTPVTDEQLQAAALGLMAAHNSLPKPTV